MHNINIEMSNFHVKRNLPSFVVLFIALDPTLYIHKLGRSVESAEV